ncbi:hypothetical protein MASR2M8_14500 [Opitutaceae bacterium]
MNFPRLAALSVLMGALSAPISAAASEQNFWPIVVERSNESAETGVRSVSAEALGSLGFHKSGDKQTLSASGLRPLYLERQKPGGRVSEAYFLYPLLSYRTQADGYRWSFLNLINRAFTKSSSAGTTDTEEALDIWPVYFSRTSKHPEASYRAVFPLAGSIPRRFGQDRLSWFLFPLYGRFEKRGTTTLTVPWPFIKILSGDSHTGFELWPLFGTRGKPGVYRERFALWPLIYDHQTWSEGGQTSGRKIGLLPFYARDEAESYRSETYVWPFFGYVDRTAPHRYHASNYLWPLWVQGQGDDRRINRWAPFYSHSLIKGTEKTWILWPLWRQSTWTEGELAHQRAQFLYFLYNANVQRSASRPDAEPASKIHVWPLVSAWNNGAGRKQWQILSPFEVFFPHNEQVRLSWSPLFALYRFDQTKPGETRHVALWNAISYHRNRAAAETEFHLGPLISMERNQDQGRLALLGGLLAWQRGAVGTGWRLGFGNFRSGSAVAPRPTSLP